MNSDQIKTMHQPKEKEKAFTLVELAIVLVIVGLLIGGVLTGQELIQQSRIKAFITDVQTIKTATSTFKLKYSQLPGDFHEDEITIMFNTHSGCVFLTNSEYQVAMLNGDKLENFYTDFETGEEGFKEELSKEALNNLFPTLSDKLEYKE